MRAATWTNVGTDVKGSKSIAFVLQNAGLDYEVEKRPVFMRTDSGEEVWIPNRFVTTRQSDDHPYDVVSDKFEVIQNHDAFDFVNYLSDDIEYERAGETENGMVYIIGKLPNVDILGDAFTPHVIFRNGFSGKVKISAAICPLRIVCQNQFNFAFGSAANTVNIRHVSNAESKLLEAREILRTSYEYMNTLKLTAEKLSSKKVSKKQMELIVNNQLFPMPRAEEDMNPYARQCVERARNAFMKAYEHDDNGNFRGTAWGLVNAYTDYMTHVNTDTSKKKTAEELAESKFVRTTFGTPMNKVLDVIAQAA